MVRILNSTHITNRLSRLLNNRGQRVIDGAKTIARRTTAMHGAGRSIDDVEIFIKDQMTSFIRSAKTKAAKVLGNA